MKSELERYDYRLEPELIAQKAHVPADECKMMVLNGKIEHKRFVDIVDYLEKGDVLVVNETKVVNAKLAGKKSTGGRVEVIMLNQNECRIKGRVRIGNKLVLGEGLARVVSRVNDIFKIEFDSMPSLSDYCLPTPPYIKQKVSDKDYQPIFAKNEGSLAAPTASLHFTRRVIEKLEKKGVEFAKVTLHIGFGTFMKVTDTSRTEPEYFEVSPKSADMINCARRVFAVGTTALKTLESCTFKGKVQATKGFSDIFIKPGHEFKSMTSGLITNFHLPKSSLLMLTAAYAGREKILEAYKIAIKRSYRFFSLGDCMLLLS